MRKIYSPLWSFQAILEGDRGAFIETVENSLLFVPFGFFLSASRILERRWIIFGGIITSICIEILQWILCLGTTELDDILTNSIGMYIGVSLFYFICGKETYTARVKKFIPTTSILLIFCLLFCINRNKMIQFAHLNDRKDGTENLLVLNGQSGYVSGTNIYIGYLENGKIAISGSSDIRTWKPIGKITLDPGSYSFSGFSGTDEKTIGIELEYLDTETDKYQSLTPDLGPIEKFYFELKEKKTVQAYVGIYPGANGDYFASPVIYKEESNY